MNLPNECQIDSFNESLIGVASRPAKSSLSYNAVSMTGDLLLLFDLVCLFLAATLSTLLYVRWLAPPGLAPGFASDFERAALVAAVLAPFILHDKRFGRVASRGHMPLLVRSYALRFTIFAGVVFALGAVSQALDSFPPGWLAIWFATSLLSTSLTRVLVAQYVRRLQRRGVLTEVIAVVGAGPVADRLVQTLRQTRPETIELLGVFDDKIAGAVPSAIKPAGTLAQLIELGKTRKIDWILLTLPPTAEHRLLSIVQRLKALSVPIGLCPQHVGLTVPYRTIDYVADGVPVSLLADRPIKRWDAVTKGAEDFLPRWIVTLALLPLAVIEALANKLAVPVIPPQRAAKSIFHFDNYDPAGFMDVAAGFGQDRYGYVVTPNADHMVRLHEDASFRAIYAAASYILLDSRFLSHVLRITKGIRLPVCTGSDMTAKLFSDVISPEDSLVLIGGRDEQARQLAERYGLRRLAHFNPPMGFIHDPKAVEACLSFVEAHSPFRFCLLAVGTPQGEAVALQLKARGIACGLTLCIGASINFLTGDERRAPLWMQRCGMEWFFRLVRAPGRLSNRYLVRGPRVFGLLRDAEIVLRKAPAPVLRLVPASSSEPALLVRGARRVPVRNRRALPAGSTPEPARAAHVERLAPALPPVSSPEPARPAYVERLVTTPRPALPPVSPEPARPAYAERVGASASTGPTSSVLS
jgi:exopolysaccharide biosynthesis WecB/TagA/CpsF family protein